MTLREIFYTLMTIAKNGESTGQDISWLRRKIHHWARQIIPFL